MPSFNEPGVTGVISQLIGLANDSFLFREQVFQVDRVQRFRIGTNSAGYRLSSIDLLVSSDTTLSGYAYVSSIRLDGRRAPGAVVGTLQNHTLSDTTFNFSAGASGIFLKPNTQYLFEIDMTSVTPLGSFYCSIISDRTATISHGAASTDINYGSSLDIADVQVTVTDDDTRGLTFAAGLWWFPLCHHSGPHFRCHTGSFSATPGPKAPD